MVIALVTNYHIFSALKKKKKHLLSYTQVSLVKIKMLAGLCFSPEATREDPCPYLFQLLDTACIPWLVAFSLHLQSHQHYTCLTILPWSHASLTTAGKNCIYLPLLFLLLLLSLPLSTAPPPTSPIILSLSLCLFLCNSPRVWKKIANR